MIPSWAKDDKISRHTYNARSETVREKPSYRRAWRQRRYGIALLDNFYEPNYVTGKAERWKIELESKEPFGIASIWDTWTDPASGELITSFSMLTVNADEYPVMKQFHRAGDEKRTPVVLVESQFDEWLDADQKHAMELMNWKNMPQLISQIWVTKKLMIMKIKKLSHQEFSKLSAEFHCLTYAEEGFTPLDQFTKSFGLDDQVLKEFADEINERD